MNTKYKKNISNYQDLLKFLAIATMIIDHIGLFIFPHDIVYRIIGRLAMPIFAFHVGYNFNYKMRHILWIYGMILIIAEYILFGIYLPNILITIALGRLYLLYEGDAIIRNKLRFFRHFCAMILLTYITRTTLDYGTLPIAFMQIGFARANNINESGYSIFASIILCILNQVIFQFNDIIDFIASISVVLIAASLLYLHNPTNPLSINLKPISRNALTIYMLSSFALIIYKVWY